VWQRLASLAEVLQDIRNQTGVPLRCQDALRETKLAVYVQNRPAREILEQIASLFGLRWRRDDDGSYVLYLPDETRRALERAARRPRGDGARLA
jgi:ferric-dicitrate binding protein FerR (iron transport regulator)